MSILRYCRLPLLCLLLASALPSHAVGLDNLPLDAQSIAQLEDRAVHANELEQPFPYTDLVHRLTELLIHQTGAGDTEHAQTTLQHIREVSARIQSGISNHTKRLKNAEILLEHTTARMTELLHHASTDDKAEFQATLRQLSSTHDLVLTVVLAK